MKKQNNPADTVSRKVSVKKGSGHHRSGTKGHSTRRISIDPGKDWLTVSDFLTSSSKAFKGLSAEMNISAQLSKSGVSDKISRELEQAFSDPMSAVDLLYEKSEKAYSDVVQYKVVSMLKPLSKFIKKVIRENETDHIYYVIITKDDIDIKGEISGVALNYTFNDPMAKRYPVFLRMMTEQQFKAMIAHGKKSNPS